MKMNMIKKHSTSPLPFQGQKRNFVKEYKVALESFPDDSIYVDLFGGSGLLSHITKTEKPNAKVIYNDYDGFKKRIKAIPQTNAILSEIRNIVSDLNNKSRIDDQTKRKILDIIKAYESKNSFIDYITLSVNLLFSMKYVNSYEELEKQTFYNRVRKSDYNAEGYLNGVSFVQEDYKVLFEKFKNKDSIIFLVDPPYLSTDCSTYKNYWKLSDYLDVLKVLIDNKYFYFTSNKSSIIELCEWIETNTGGKNPFNKAKIKYHYNPTSHNTGYNDIMLYKNWTTDSTL